MTRQRTAQPRPIEDAGADPTPTPTADGEARPGPLERQLETLGLLPDQAVDAADLRAAEWCSSFKPCNAFEGWLVDRIAVEALRVERCTRQESLHRTLAARRAKLCWDDDRRVEVEVLGARLADDPAPVRLRLEQSRHGCEWLLARWRALLDALDRRGGWSEAESTRALDLLGVASELREAADLGSKDPEALRALARGEVERLEARSTGELARLDAAQRQLAEVGMGREDDPTVRAIRRYETSCLRRLEWAWAQFKKGRHDLRHEPPPGRPSPPTREPQPPAQAPQPSPTWLGALTLSATPIPAKAPPPWPASWPSADRLPSGPRRKGRGVPSPRDARTLATPR